MARLRSNNVFGTVDNNPLAAGGTSLSADELANLVAVTGTDTAVITLDPNRVNGAPEIVYVTAHSASATTATILRGQEGTAARAHPQGTFWVHAATRVDFGSDPRTSYTPTLGGSGGVLGNGTMVGRYRERGKELDLHVLLIWGSTTTYSGGPWTFSLPTGYTAVAATEQFMSARAFDTSAARHFHGPAEIAASGTAVLPRIGDQTQVLTSIGGTTPMTWATGDSLSVYGTIEIA